MRTWTLYHLVPARLKVPGWDAYLYYLRQMIEAMGDAVVIKRAVTGELHGPALVTGLTPGLVTECAKLPEWVPIVAHSLEHASGIWSASKTFDATILDRHFIAGRAGIVDCLVMHGMMLYSRCPIPYVRSPAQVDSDRRGRAVFMGRLHVSRGIYDAMSVNCVLRERDQIRFRGYAGGVTIRGKGFDGRWDGGYEIGHGPMIASDYDLSLYLATPAEDDGCEPTYVVLESMDAGVPVVAWESNADGVGGPLMAGVNCIGIRDTLDLANLLAGRTSPATSGEPSPSTVLERHTNPWRILNILLSAMRGSSGSSNLHPMPSTANHENIT